MEEYKKVDSFDSWYNGKNLEIECTMNKFGQTIYLGAGFTRAKVLNPEVIMGLKNKQRIIGYGTESIKIRKMAEFGKFDFLMNDYKILE